MRCPSCNAAYGDQDRCSECGAIALSFSDTAVDESASIDPAGPSNNSIKETRKRSTLIEFPGVVRSTVPEWRRELSERVREVQERRAREAAAEAAEAERLRLTAEVQPPPQLELLPQATAPAMNPLVAAALRRIERANKPIAPAPAMSHSPARATATAIAYAPEHELESTPDKPSTTLAANVDVAPPSVEVKPPQEKTHNLVVVPPPETVTIEKKPAKRLISDTDPSLNYLDAISTTMCIDEVDVRRPGLFRRLIAALVDLIFCAVLFSPFVAALQFTLGEWNQPQILAMTVGGAAFVVFLYLTAATAFTGRTVGKRLFGLRTLDKRTGLIPTGTQSAGRALFFVISLLTGLPILLSMLDREGRAVHDRVTGTVVMRG